jgi:nucleolar complex protein 2
MTKASKRERKFQASGGVKSRLEKGTITNKGKLRSKRKKQSGDAGAPRKPAEVASPKRTGNDFLGEDNLADLDIDSFFAKVADATSTLVEDAPVDGDESADEVQKQGSDDEGSSEGEKKHHSKKETKSKAMEVDTSSNEDSDEEEDLDAAEASMKAEMSKMKQADPDFHDFLQENEQQLLEFGHEDGGNEDGDDEEDMEMDVDSSSKKTSQNQVHLTKKVLAALEKGTFNSHGIKSLKKLVAAYKAACHLADASGANEGGFRPGESGSLYIIDSSKIFDALMVMCLNRCHEEFQHHLLGTNPETDDSASKDKDKADDETTEDDKPLNPKTLEKAARWDEVQPIMLSFFRSTLHVMSEAKEPELLSFILKALAKYLRFMTPFPRIADSMLKTLTSLWSAPLDTSEDYQVVRLNAFFRIRQLALTQPFPFIEDILKKTYLAYARRAKFGTAATVSSVLPTLTFMGNGLCELYSLDHHSSYQHAFVYIRQLALLLRAAMHKKTPEAMQQVYCWQFIHCLKLWVAVLSDSVTADDDDKNSDVTLMRSLIYPLTEVILGTVRFVPSPTRHLPLRFHCVRLLQQLAASSQVFIPTTSLLLECFDWKEWAMAPKKSSKAGGMRGGLQIDLILKLVPKEDALRTHEHREAGINTLFLLLNREVELYRYSAGFPEFSIRIVQRLRLFSKQASSQPRWRALAKSCVETCEQYSAFAVQARSKLQEAPKDVKRLECLLPVSEKNMQERHAVSIQREQKLQQLDVNKTATPKVKKDDKTDEGDANETKNSKKRKSRTTKKKTKKPQKDAGHDSAVQGDDRVLEQEDKLQEGVDWSDEEE